MSLKLAFVAAFAFAAASATGCQVAKPPQLTVIGSSAADTHAEVVFVQVTNPASRPMKLTKLEYAFAADGGATVARGELELDRAVPSGAAVVVEVPMDGEASGAVTLTGTLTAQLDEIVQSFKLSAKIAPN